MHPPLSIVHFSDYRAFLVAYAQWRKSKNHSWSYSGWAKKLGLKNTSSITKIIQGKREPGTAITEKLIQYFKFSQSEANYFSDLISLQKLKKDPRLSSLILEKIHQTSGELALNQIDHRTFSVISNWYCLAIREMTQLGDFLEDEAWISKKFRFKLSGSEVRSAIKSLIAVGLLRRNEKKLLAVCNKRIETKSDVSSEAVKQYFEQILERTKEAVRTIDVSERDFSSTSFVMRMEDLEPAKEMLREFRRKFCKTFEVANGDTLFQFQQQLFPLTRKEHIQ